MLYNSFVKYYTTYMVNTMTNDIRILQTEQAQRLINEAFELAKTLPDIEIEEDPEIQAIVDSMTIEEQREYIRRKVAERDEIMKDWDD